MKSEGVHESIVHKSDVCVQKIARPAPYDA